RVLVTGKGAHDRVDYTDDGCRVIECVPYLLAERILVREEVFAELAADDDHRHEVRRVRPGERWLDLLVPDVATGDELDAQRVETLLIDLDVVDITVARRVRTRDHRVVVAAVRERNGIGRRRGQHPAHPAEVGEVLLDRGGLMEAAGEAG